MLSISLGDISVRWTPCTSPKVIVSQRERLVTKIGHKREALGNKIVTCSTENFDLTLFPGIFALFSVCDQSHFELTESLSSEDAGERGCNIFSAKLATRVPSRKRNSNILRRQG